jgi:hypothetical protein
MVSDPTFIEDARRASLELDPLSGDKVTEVVRGIIRTPADVIRRFKEITE